MHDHQAVCVGQCKLLIAKTGTHPARLRQLVSVEALQTERGECLHERQKLRRPVFVVALKKPAVPFCDHER